MRTWRVGTISMGAALFFLGVFLLLAQLLKWDSAYILASWWPVLLIVLGAEILVYLITSRQEKPVLKYDFLSIFLVGIIGTVGIGFTVLQATGLLQQVQTVMDTEVRTSDLPAFALPVEDRIKRVVVDTSQHPITIESSIDKEVSVFGTYRAQNEGKEPTINGVEDYLFTNVKGDTLYISFKELPENTDLFQSRYTSLKATLVIPATTSLEVTNAFQEVTLKPRRLLGSWEVSGHADLNVTLSKDDNVTLYANNVQSFEGDTSKWTFARPTQSTEGEEEEVLYGEPAKSASLKVGTGEYPITLSNTSSVTVSIAN